MGGLGVISRIKCLSVSKHGHNQGTEIRDCTGLSLIVLVPRGLD